MNLKWIGLIFLAGLVLSGCSNGEELNIYSSRHYDTDRELYDRFTEETGIKINLIEGSADELIERIKSEGQNSPADILITVDAGRLWRAEEAGILQPVQSEILEERIPDNLQHPENYWFGLSRRVRGIIYNKENVDTSELTSYADLADEKWDGRVCVRSSNNIYNQSLVASMIESQGVDATEEWASGLVNNFARDPQGGDTDQIRAVAAGLCDLALANHYYYMRLKTSDDPADQEVAEAVGIFFPSAEAGGAHVNISGAGVVEGAPHKENAIRFLEYLTENESQITFVSGNYEFPVVEGVELPQALEPFAGFASDAVNVSAYGENNPDAIRLMDRVGWK
jgi:iron(III) transport system substrate-binding protein